MSRIARLADALNGRKTVLVMAGAAAALAGSATASAATMTSGSHAGPARKGGAVEGSAQRTPDRHAAARRPYEIYDSVTPSQIPAPHAVATYADGGYAGSPAALPPSKHVLMI